MLGLCIFTGCMTEKDKKYSMEDLDNLAKIEIYSAENDKLLKTIEDEKNLYRYNQCISIDDTDIEKRKKELEKSIEGKKEQYYLIAYKHSVARFSKEKVEKTQRLHYMKIVI